MKEYVLLIMSDAGVKPGYVYADSHDRQVRLDPFNQGYFIFYKHLGCLKGREEVFRIAGYSVISMSTHDIPPGLEIAPRYGGWWNRQT